MGACNATDRQTGVGSLHRELSTSALIDIVSPKHLCRPDWVPTVSFIFIIFLHSFIDDWNVSVRDADGHTTSVTNLRIRRQYCCTTCQLTVKRHLFTYLLALPTQATPRVCMQGTQIGSTSRPHGSQRRSDDQKSEPAAVSLASRRSNAAT